MVLLDIDYVTRGEKAIIRLFGREKNDANESIIVLDDGFQPYIYVVPRDIEECQEQIEELNVVKVEKVKMKDLAKEKYFIKVTFNHPQDVPKLRDKIRDLSSVKEIREHDIPFYRRYLIDKGLFPMAEVEVEGKTTNPIDINEISNNCQTKLFKLQGEIRPISSDFPNLNILSLDIEVYNPKGMPKSEKDPIIMISLSSNQGLQKVISTARSSLDFVETVKNESKLLKDLLKSYKEDLTFSLVTIPI